MRTPFPGAPRETNIASFRPQLPLTEEAGVKALELVERAIERVEHSEQANAETHARVDMLARKTIEYVHAADERARSAEMARQGAEAQVERQSVKLRQVELELERAITELAAVRTEISASESRAREAERRTTEVDNALKNLETMIHRILSKRQASVGFAA